MRWLLLSLLPACVAVQPHTFEQTELELELAEDQMDIGFELVLDIREGAMPDPELYSDDNLWVDLTLQGRFEVDVMLGPEPKPRKGGRAKRGTIFELNDIAADCRVGRACQRVVTVDVRRERKHSDLLFVYADFSMWATQATVNLFPTSATEQEIRLRAFER